MSYCGTCGTPLTDGIKFCPVCGTPVQAAPTSGVPDFPSFTPPAQVVDSEIPAFNVSEPAASPDLPTFDPPTVEDVEIPNFTPPEEAENPQAATPTAVDTEDIPTFAPPAENKVSSDIPIFTPPADNAPTFTPPANPVRNFSGPACYHHPDEPAAGQCARCGKYICRDCVDVYTVLDGEYANQCLCYDCCQELVAQNVTDLKKQRGKIIALFVATVIGMIIGGAAFSESGSAGAVIFGVLWFGSFWTWLKTSVVTWWRDPNGPSLAGFIGACLGGAIIAPIKTVIKIVQCITYLIRTSKFIQEDSEALVQMRDYMEYTQVMSRNRGVDLEDLMGQGSELYNNAYAQSVSSQGAEAAEANLRQYTTRIAENGEIIRDFAA